MESNDMWKMEEEWNQVFVMMEQAELSDFVINSSLKFERIPLGPLVRTPPNLINHFETKGGTPSVNKHRSFKNTTKSYHCLSKSCESGNRNYGDETESNDRIKRQVYGANTGSNNRVKRQVYGVNTGNSDQIERQVYRSGTEKSRAQESGFGSVYSTLSTIRVLFRII